MELIAQSLEDIKAECVANITLSEEGATRFFKTGRGTYSEHDKFLGITVPKLRKIANKYETLELDLIEELLRSQYNEERLLALMILVNRYQKSDVKSQNHIYEFYLRNKAQINNWNLVDLSAHHIIGHYLNDKERSILNELASSKVLWERRIAIVATWYFIRQNDLSTTFEIAEQLLNDKHDLIHKAVGWMLREAGKKDEAMLVSFLKLHSKQMPRTMLRYAVERLSEELKRLLMKKA